MKKFLIITALFLFAGITFGQTLKKGNLIGVHHYKVTPKPGYTMDQIVEFYVDRYCPSFEKAFPGLQLYFMKGNRGEHEQEFGLIFLFESKEIRDKYWPAKDVSSALASEGQIKMADIYAEQNKILTLIGDHTDYVIQ